MCYNGSIQPAHTRLWRRITEASLSRKADHNPPSTKWSNTMERLHKFLARAGVDSRRACEELMLAGRVTVNGRVQRELGTQIDPAADDIRVDGEPITLPTELHYVLLYKPTGVITSMEDPQGRPTVADLIQ